MVLETVFGLVAASVAELAGTLVVTRPSAVAVTT